MRAISLLAALWLLAGPSAAPADTWVRIDTGGGVLTVLQDDRVILTLDDISIGRGGTGPRVNANHVTPLGNFRVAWINRQSRYHLFFGLDYPTREHAYEAYTLGRIDWDTMFDIFEAAERGVLPPQDTPLGGYIGIHGLGDGDPRLHARFNWTEGCIAVSNEQIDRLASWVNVGTRVVIK